MSKGLKVFLILALICAALAGGWYLYNDRTFVVPEFIKRMELEEKLGFLKDIEAFRFLFPEEDNKEKVYVNSVETLMGVASGIQNRFAGVVEAQEKVEIQADSGRKIKTINVKVGDTVTIGQLLFEYDLSSTENKLKEAQLELDRLANAAISYADQIATLEWEKDKADANAQLSYTVEIETARMNLKKNEYDQISKAAEIEQLQKALGNTEVKSEISGIVQKIDTSKISSSEESNINDSLTEDSYTTSSDNTSNSFITILSTGAYRVKGMTNELNISIIESSMGTPVIIRSRMKEEDIWHGIMGAVDRENSSSQSSSSFYDSGDSTTSSSSYPFYVALDSSEGLMLGQHVYIELDEGQENVNKGVWLYNFYIVDADTDTPYVWASDSEKRLEKRYVKLGEFDEALMEYEILEGLTNDDYITYPVEGLREGIKTTVGTREQVMDSMNNGSFEESDVEFVDESFDGAGNEETTVDDFSEEDVIVDEDFSGNDADALDNGDHPGERSGAVNAEDDVYMDDEGMEDAVYYDENGNEISEEEFFADLNESGNEDPGGNKEGSGGDSGGIEAADEEALYYDENGNQITEEEFFSAS